MSLTVALTPLPLLKRVNGVLLRTMSIAVSVDVPREGERGILEMRYDGRVETSDLGRFETGRQEFTVFVPEVSHEESVVALVRYADQRWTETFRLVPARRWTVHLVLHSHTDLGFTDPISTVALIHNENTDRAIELCRETASWPGGSRFKWTCEVSWQVQQFIAARSPEKVEELMKLVRADSIGVGAMYSGEQTDLLGHEEAVRAFSYAAYLRRRYGIPCDTAMLCDVPGFTAGMVQIMAKSGLPNLILADNNFIAPVLARTDLPRPFWWNGADDTRVLCWYTDHPYYAYIEGEYYGFTKDVQTVAAMLPEKLRSLESAGYPFDRLQLQYAFDNFRLDTRPLDIVREWNTLWEFPKVVLSTAREFLNRLRQEHPGDIPSRSGDLTNWWAGVSGGFPIEAALTRRCHERAPAAELLWTAAVTHRPSLTYPGGMIAGVYDGLLAFDEHSGSGMLWQPKSDEEQQQALREGYGYLYGAAATLDRLESEAIASLNGNDGSPADSRQFAVFNGTGLARSEWVQCPFPAPDASAGVLDDVTGDPVPWARVSDDEMTVFARDVPPYGYRRFRLSRSEAEFTPPARKAKASVDTDFVVLMNPQVRLMIDRRTGFCVSLSDAVSGREFLGQEPLFNRAMVYACRPVVKIELGKYIPEIFTGVENPGETLPWPASSRATLEWGEDPLIGVTCRVSHAIDGLEWLTQEYMLAQEGPGLRVANVLRRAVCDNLRLKEALSGFFDPSGMLYFAFAFALPGGEFEYEGPASVLRPSEMQFKGSCHDFFALQRWCRITDGETSLAVSSPDIPLVDVGSIGLLKFKPALDRNQSSLFFRAVPLKEWGSETESPFSKSEDLQFRFGIGVTSAPRRAGTEAVGGRIHAHELGLAMHNPLRAFSIGPDREGPFSPAIGSWCSLSPSNIELMTMKKADFGDGVIVRIREIAGQAAAATMAFPGFRIISARSAMVTEEALDPAPVIDNAIHARMAPFSIHTFAVTLAREEGGGPRA